MHQRVDLPASGQVHELLLLPDARFDELELLLQQLGLHRLLEIRRGLAAERQSGDDVIIRGAPLLP
jgi:hypothetical protein